MNNHPQTQTLSIALLLCSLATAAAGSVKFQVNMGSQITWGNFDPATGTVTARGSFNSWANTFMLTNSSSNTNIYTGVFDVQGALGSTNEYKFVFDNGGGDQWEEPVSTAGGNRTFVLGSPPQVLPVVFFCVLAQGVAPVGVAVQVVI